MCAQFLLIYGCELNHLGRKNGSQSVGKLEVAMCQQLFHDNLLLKANERSRTPLFCVDSNHPLNLLTTISKVYSFPLLQKFEKLKIFKFEFLKKALTKLVFN